MDLKLVVSGGLKYFVAAGVMGIILTEGMHIVHGAVLQLVVLVPIGAAVYFAVLGIIIFGKKHLIRISDKKEQ